MFLNAFLVRQFSLPDASQPRPCSLNAGDIFQSPNYGPRGPILREGGGSSQQELLH